MKRYEMLGIDLNTVEGLGKCIGIKCQEIDDGINENWEKCKYPNDSNVCNRCKAERLFAEVPTMKVQRGTTYTDFSKAYSDWLIEHGENSLLHKDLVMYQNWLAEEIEVEA